MPWSEEDDAVLASIVINVRLAKQSVFFGSVPEAFQAATGSKRYCRVVVQNQSLIAVSQQPVYHFVGLHSLGVRVLREKKAAWTRQSRCQLAEEKAPQYIGSYLFTVYFRKNTEQQPTVSLLLFLPKKHLTVGYIIQLQTVFIAFRLRLLRIL